MVSGWLPGGGEPRPAAERGGNFSADAFGDDDEARGAFNALRAEHAARGSCAAVLLRPRLTTLIRLAVARDYKALLTTFDKIDLRTMLPK